MRQMQWIFHAPPASTLVYTPYLFVCYCGLGVRLRKEELLCLLGPQEVDSGGFLGDVEAGNNLERSEIDNFHSARFRPDAFDRNEGIAIVRWGDETVQHASPRGRGRGVAARF